MSLKYTYSSAREKARFAGDLVHGHGIPTHGGGDGFRGVDDLGAAAFLLFLTAFGDVIHEAAHNKRVVDIVSTNACMPSEVSAGVLVGNLSAGACKLNENNYHLLPRTLEPPRKHQTVSMP